MRLKRRPDEPSHPSLSWKQAWSFGRDWASARSPCCTNLSRSWGARLSHLMACRQDWGLQRLGALEKEWATGLSSTSEIVLRTHWQYRLVSLCWHGATISRPRI